MRKVSLRTVTMHIQSQQVITKDNVSIGVAAVAYFRRVDLVKSIVEIENVEAAISQIAQTTVRNVVGRSPLDHVLAETETLNEKIKEILDATTELEKRGKIIAAEGEALSAGKLAEAADVIGRHPIALQLRNLQVLGEIAIERDSTIVFPAQLMDSVRPMNTSVHGEIPAARDLLSQVG